MVFLTEFLIALLLAPIIGSFLGVLIRRVPRGEPIIVARSRCETCGATLSPAEMVPIVSYLCQGGKCGRCQAPIGRFHFWIELAAMLVPIWAAFVHDGEVFWADCILGWGLLALGWIDTEHMILPDRLTLPLVLLGLGEAALFASDTLLARAIGAVAGYIALRLINAAYRSVRGRDGLGAGDAKLLAAAGAWVGWDGLGDVVLIAALAGLTVALVIRFRGHAITATTAIPFGPFLALGLWLVRLYESAPSAF